MAPSGKRPGIRAVSGLSGTLFGSMRPLGRTLGFASALAVGSGTAAAQPVEPPSSTPGAPPDLDAEPQPEPAPSPPPVTPPPASAQPPAPLPPPAAVAPAPPEPAAPTTLPASTVRAPAEPLVLPAVKVEGQAEGYRTPQSRLERLPRPLVDTPQAVAVVPEQVIDEQRATTVRDALRNVSGITMGAGEGGRQGDTFILRGFSGQSDVFRDGSRDLGWFTRDTFNLEGVEVFFGPSAVLFGRGSTGGAVNLVTKAPRRGTFADVTLSAASAPQCRIEADANHAVNDRIQLRANAMGQMGGVAGRDTVQENRAGFAPSARVVLGERTLMTIDYLYQRERGVPDYGHPYHEGYPVSARLGVPRSTFYGVEGSDTEQVDAHIATGRVSHDFGPRVRLSNALRFGVVDRLARPTAPRNVAPADNPTSVGRNRFETGTMNLNLVNQTDLRLEFATWFLQHVANTGVELAREERRQTRHNFQILGPMGMPTSITGDLRAPDPSPDLSAVDRVFSADNRGLQLSAAFYASDQIRLNRFVEILGSMRLDSFGADYTATNAMGVVTDLEKRDLLLNWRGGLVFHPIEKTSLYGMWGTSSNPSAEAGTLSEATASLDPERNVVYEVGAKADLLAEQLSLGGSAFRVDKTNARVPGTDPMGPPQILAGRQRVQGFNAGAAGTLFDRWKLIASYTLLRSELRDHTNPLLIGQALPNTPEHSLALWTTVMVLKNLVLGGGAVYQAETTTNNPAMATQVLNSVPDFWRFDAFASYAFRHAEVQVNVANLTDQLYCEQFSGGHAVPAEGRVVLLSARLRL